MLEQHQYRGYSLLEVLITLLVLAVGLLALLKMQWLALQDNHAFKHRSLAINQADNLAETFYANAAVTLAASDITRWNHENAELLPSGTGEVTQENERLIIRLYWQGKGAYQHCSSKFLPNYDCIQIKV